MNTIVNYSVGEVARVSGVTVRTLHHYDGIGLLAPSGRTEAGYRSYDDADLERLAQILSYRELGFSLDEVAAILDDPRVDRLEHLRRQHRLLTERIERLQQMKAAVELTLEAAQMGISLTPEERFEVFGGLDPAEHAREAEDRWGDTDAYRESARRTSGYTKADWQRITAEARDIEARLAAALVTGIAADTVTAMDLAEEHRQHIAGSYYNCPPRMHRSLADMYVEDPRFALHYEAVAPGLAAYVREAVHANADRQPKL
jgi:DNA-binding transcriptional MerR regulator